MSKKSKRMPFSPPQVSKKSKKSKCTPLSRPRRFLREVEKVETYAILGVSRRNVRRFRALGVLRVSVLRGSHSSKKVENVEKVETYAIFASTSGEKVERS